MKELALISSIFIVFLHMGCDREPLPEKPNIVLIMADDLGYGGIGCYGNATIATPNLDALARQGIRFTDFHSNGAVCSPTRAALMTGNYQQRSGLEGVIYVRGETRETGLAPAETTIAEMLKSNGYTTGIMGKWHLGYNKEYNPVRQGFDEFYGYLSGNVDYHSHYDGAGIYDWWHNTDTIPEEGYVTDLITQHSVDFINQHKDEPFFLYVSHEAPHVPFQSRSDSAYRFPGREFSYHGPVEDTSATYRKMVEAMDEGIGEIVSTLQRLHLDDNTLIFFLSDNGAEAFGDNGGLNGQKGKLLEGGHRVPAIAYWKNKISPGVSPATLMSMDLLPTFLFVSHTEPGDTDFDGVDFSSVLFEDKDSTLPERPLFWRYNNQKAVREGKWKLLITQTDTALYNLSQDVKETNNLARENAALVADLSAKLLNWEQEVTENVTMRTR